MSHFVGKNRESEKAVKGIVQHLGKYPIFTDFLSENKRTLSPLHSEGTTANSQLA